MGGEGMNDKRNEEVTTKELAIALTNAAKEAINLSVSTEELMNAMTKLYTKK
jgi:hypothetical protein